MTAEQMAEAFERARYEQLRTASWADLREGERAARIDVARQAFDAAGITARFAALETIAEEAELQAGVVAQRDAEITRLRSEHDELLAALRTEHRLEVERLEAHCEVLREQRDEAAGRADAAEARAVRAEGTIAQVRTALSGADALVQPTVGTDVAAEANAEERLAGAGVRRLPRLVRAGARA